MAEFNHKFNFRLDTDMLNKLLGLAQGDQRKVSGVIRALIAEGLQSRGLL